MIAGHAFRCSPRHDNRSTGQRADFASSNSIASFQGNVSGDGSGPKTEPEID